MSYRKKALADTRADDRQRRGGALRLLSVQDHDTTGKPVCQKCLNTARSLWAIAAQLWLLAHELDGREGTRP